MKLIITLTLTGDAAADMSSLPTLSQQRLGVVNGDMRRRIGLYLANKVDPGEATLTIVRKPGWVAGWNIPGYMPDEEPRTFDTREEAVAHLDDELERALQDRLELHEATVEPTEHDRHARWLDRRDVIKNTYNRALDALRGASSSGPFWVQCGNHVWWVAEEQA